MLRGCFFICPSLRRSILSGLRARIGKMFRLGWPLRGQSKACARRWSCAGNNTQPMPMRQPRFWPLMHRRISRAISLDVSHDAPLWRDAEFDSRPSDLRHVGLVLRPSVPSECPVGRDALLDADLEGSLHLRFLVTQFGGVVAGRHEAVGLVAAVFGAKFLGDAEVPVQARQPRHPDLLKLGDALAAGVGNDQAELLAGELAEPNSE